MGKGVDPWDDSALIDAFEDAMTTYKGSFGRSDDAGEDDPDGQDVPKKAESNNFCASASATVVPCDGIETATGVLTDQGPHPTYSEAPESLTYPPQCSSFPAIQQNEEYNQLLNQYYELKAQGSKVLQQLYQISYSNDQAQVQGSASYAYPAPEYGTSGSGLQFSTCSCSCLAALPCPFMQAPSCHASSCSTGGLFTGGSTCCPLATPCCSLRPAHQSLEDYLMQCTVPCAVNAGAKAGKDPNSVLETPLPTLADVCEGEETGKRDKEDANPGASKPETPSGDSADLDADLGVVLHAWYTAGLYTGRYLAERSHKRRSE